jgi:hypothetical protein
VLNDVLCDCLQDFHALAANKRQLVFGGLYLLANGISCPLIWILFFIVSFNMRNALELSVWRDVAGWMWPNSVSVTLSGAPLERFISTFLLLIQPRR